VSVPDACPGCGRPLHANPLDRPVPHWQPRARLLFLLGAVISGPLFLAAPVVGAQILAAADPQGKLVKGDRGSIGLILWVAAAVVALLPGLVLGARAYRMPRVLKLHCAVCGWNETVALPRVRYGRPAATDPGAVE
jgi:hypothetical protein